MADHHPDHPSGYEKRDANVLGITIVAVAVVVLVVLFVVWLDDYFVHTREELTYEMSLKPVSPERLELEARDDSLLSTYGVTADTAEVTYRIPIEAAMKLVAAEHGADTSAMTR